MVRIVCVISLLLSLQLEAAQQLVLVVAEEWESTTAKLQRYVQNDGSFAAFGEAITVNLGRSGLGWGEGGPFVHNTDEPVKREGDGRAPAGIFRLGELFGYPASVQTKMPYRHATPDLVCIDDSGSKHYNRLVRLDGAMAIKSFEWMRRDDNLYELGVTVRHNEEQLKERGSCIFLHVEKGKDMPTSGCTSMPLASLKEIASWLDPSAEPLLVQIPASYCGEVSRRFPGISCP
jgi:L,D-peptidoglycan transpeptidase YkuD (ErfK/YbiS/YcfS/YnhG family)